MFIKVYIDALDRLGRNYDGIIGEWKYITRELNADIIILENQSLFDSRKFKEMGDMGKLMEDQFLSLYRMLLRLNERKFGSVKLKELPLLEKKVSWDVQPLIMYH